MTPAHIGGLPVEETLGSLGPALLVGLGVAWANLRAGLRRARSHAHAKPGMRTRFGQPVNRATAARGPALTLACLLGLLVLADSVPARRGEALLVNQANGVAGNAGSDSPSISADGRFVAFESRADNFSAGDDNSFTNVFRQDLRGPVPVCSDVAETVPRGGVATVTLPCRDDDGDPITRTVVSSPAHGKLGPVDQATGTVSYMPDPGYTGPDSFSFQGSDASGSSAPASASLTMTATQPIVAFGTDRLVTLTLARARIPAKGPVAVRVSNANDFPVSGKLSGRTAERVPTRAHIAAAGDRR